MLIVFAGTGVMMEILTALLLIGITASAETVVLLQTVVLTAAGLWLLMIEAVPG